MLARLNKPQRRRAGWCIALAYLFCLLAPSVSFAFADGSRSAPCIIEDHGPGMHMHGSADRHVHDAGAIHDHSHGPSAAQQGATVHEDAAVPIKGPQKTADTRCCGLISLSAIPAGETGVVKPTALTSRCEIESTRDIADNAPPRLYRPPIS
jgi:hypothetical protein